MPWKSFINNQNKDLCNDDALDLLSKMLVYDKVNKGIIRGKSDNELLGRKNYSKRSFRTFLFCSCKKVKFQKGGSFERESLYYYSNNFFCL